MCLTLFPLSRQPLPGYPIIPSSFPPGLSRPVSEISLRPIRALLEQVAPKRFQKRIQPFIIPKMLPHATEKWKLENREISSFTTLAGFSGRDTEGTCAKIP